ncbi:hypothetical protein X961_5201 [Burkholderia pseudomallei MSHR5613]|nr:hypothetical protein X961_5201 [Burkholderia pseudomallei MSHR5613]
MDRPGDGDQLIARYYHPLCVRRLVEFMNNQSPNFVHDAPSSLSLYFLIGHGYRPAHRAGNLSHWEMRAAVRGKKALSRPVR